MPNKYTLKQFNEDMSQLGGMIENFYEQNGGLNTNKNGSVKKTNGSVKNNLKKNLKSSIKKNIQNLNDVRKNLVKLNSMVPNKKSNKKSDVKRSFKIISVNGEPYTYTNLYHGKEPKTAAKNAGKRICEKLKLYKNSNKYSCKIVSFELQEATRGSDKRTYGPYTAEYEKLDKPKILKFSKFPNKVIKPITHKFVVKLKKN